MRAQTVRFHAKSPINYINEVHIFSLETTRNGETYLKSNAMALLKQFPKIVSFHRNSSVTYCLNELLS